MKICQAHWDRLLEGINDRGMGHLIKDAQTNFDNAVDELEGGRGINDPTKFDPLQSAAWHIMSVGIQNLGMRGMVEDICPLCEARKDFDLHNTPTGRCDKPECPIQVNPGDKPWDEQLMFDQCLDPMRAHCIQTGLIQLS